MFSRLILLLPGSIDYNQLTDFFTSKDYIIAVDGGIEHSEALNVIPNLWVGDFDSCRKESLNKYQHIPIEQHPTDKAYLDTELALSKIYDLNTNHCIILGGIGGLLDHQLGLFMLLTAHPTIHFIHTDGQTILYSLNDECHLTIPRNHYHRLSIVPITQLEGVTSQGVKWPLTNYTLPTGLGHSLSNEITGPIINYSQTKGLGWIILS